MNNKKILLIKVEFNDDVGAVNGWVVINNKYYAFVSKGWVDIVISGKLVRRPPSYSYSKIDMPILLVKNQHLKSSTFIPERYSLTHVLEQPVEIKNMHYNTLQSIRDLIKSG